MVKKNLTPALKDHSCKNQTVYIRSINFVNSGIFKVIWKKTYIRKNYI
jgi:hypothetical protein